MKRSCVLLLATLPLPAAAMTLSIPGHPDGSFATTRQAACGGQDISPALAWRDLPRGTKSLALTIFDPDAGGGAGYVHWVLYGLPAASTGLREAAGSQVPDGGTGGTNSPGNDRYYGMCPPVGDPPHHYIFHLYALDLPPRALRPGLSEPGLRAAISGHVLGEAEVTLLYRRS